MIDPAKLRLTTLVENTTARRGILAEMGLCILVEADGRRILLDTGASPVTASHNAQMLGVDLSAVDTIVLSHGHFDHTGGLPGVLSAIGREIEIIAHPAVWGLKYSQTPRTGDYIYGGIPYHREELERLGARFILTAEPTWIGEDIVISGEEPMTTDFEAVDDVCYVKEDGRFVPDPMADDQSIYIKTELGLVIILGCAHRGAINIIRHARQLTGVETVYMVVGGTHLFRASTEQLDQTISSLMEIGVQKLAVSHCTGMKQAAIMAQVFGDQFMFNNAGTVIKFI